MHNDIEKILLTHEEIVARCDELGKQISEDYNAKGETPLLITLLKGSIPFLSELMQHIDIDGLEYDTMYATSYEGTESSGTVVIKRDIFTDVKGKSILLVDDILDTGRTLQKIRDVMLDRGAKDVKIAALLLKEERRIVKDLHPDYVGFVVPNEFVVGFGLDYEQKYRNLPFIGVLKKEIYGS